MKEDFGSAKKIGIFPREEELKNKWKGINERVTVNESQYSFGQSEIFKNFENNQFENNPIEYEKYNFYREEWYRRGKNYDPGNAPLAVCCELVSTCNLGCSMCYTITEEFQDSVVGATRMLPWKVVKQVIDESAKIGVFSILFSWRGESSLYRVKSEDGKTILFSDVLKYARSKNIIEVSCLTHGQNFDEESIEEIVKARPNWLNFSIDGLSSEYNKIRTPKNKQKDKNYNAFEKVCENIKLFNKIKKKYNTKRPQLRTNAVFPSIYKNPKEYADHLYKIGIDWVTVNEMLDFRFDEVDDSEIKQDWACSYPIQRLTVSANGTILPCTGAHNEEEGLVIGRYIGAPKKIVKEGNRFKPIELNQMTLKEAWNSKKLNKIRELHKTNRRCEIKKGCRNCRHGMKKRGVDWVPDEWNLDTMKWEGHIWRNG